MRIDLYRGRALRGLGATIAMQNEGYREDGRQNAAHRAKAVSDGKRSCQNRGLHNEKYWPKPLQGPDLDLVGLQEARRRWIVDAVIGAVIDIPDERARTRALTQLCLGIRHLNDAQRRRVVDAVLGGEDEQYKAQALAALGPSLCALDGGQRGRIIAAAIGMRNEAYRAEALAALGPSLYALSTAQCDQIVHGVIGIRQKKHRDFALAKINSELSGLCEAHRKLVIDATARIVDGSDHRDADFKSAGYYVPVVKEK